MLGAAILLRFGREGLVTATTNSIGLDVDRLADTLDGRCHSALTWDIPLSCLTSDRV
jgi:hypothetical protein